MDSPHLIIFSFFTPLFKHGFGVLVRLCFTMRRLQCIVLLAAAVVSSSSTCNVTLNTTQVTASGQFVQVSWSCDTASPTDYLALLSTWTDYRETSPVKLSPTFAAHNGSVTCVSCFATGGASNVAANDLRLFLTYFHTLRQVAAAQPASAARCAAAARRLGCSQRSARVLAASRFHQPERADKRPRGVGRAWLHARAVDDA